RLSDGRRLGAAVQVPGRTGPGRALSVREFARRIHRPDSDPAGLLRSPLSSRCHWHWSRWLRMDAAPLAPASVTPSPAIAEVGESEEENGPDTVDGAEPQERLGAADQPPAGAAHDAPDRLRQDGESTEQGEQARYVGDGEHTVDARSIRQRSENGDPRAHHGQHQQNADAGGKPQALFLQSDEKRGFEAAPDDPTADPDRERQDEHRQADLAH